MRLSILLELKQWDVRQPILHPEKGGAWPDGLYAHVAGHLVGGIVLFTVFSLFFHWLALELTGTSMWLTGPSIIAAVLYQSARQEWMMEVPSIGLPLWSAIWDVTTCAVGAKITALIVP